MLCRSSSSWDRALSGKRQQHPSPADVDGGSRRELKPAEARPGPQVGISVCGVQVLQDSADGRLRRQGMPRLQPQGFQVGAGQVSDVFPLRTLLRDRREGQSRWRTTSTQATRPKGRHTHLLHGARAPVSTTSHTCQRSAAFTHRLCGSRPHLVNNGGAETKWDDLCQDPKQIHHSID